MNKDPRNWPGWLQWSSVGGILAAVVLLGQAASSLEYLEPWIPAHRGFVLGQVTATSEAVTRSLQSLELALAESDLRAARASKVQLEASVRASPEDLYLRNALESKEAEVRSLEERVNTLRCRQRAVLGLPCL